MSEWVCEQVSKLNSSKIKLRAKMVSSYSKHPADPVTTESFERLNLKAEIRLSDVNLVSNPLLNPS